MKFSSRQPEPAGMQLAPMIDIVFLLLIFFIVTWQFSRSETELNVSVPTAEEGAVLDRPKGEIIINILADGVIRVEGNTVDLPQLQDKLAAIARQFENQPVRIRGDGRSPTSASSRSSTPAKRPASGTSPSPPSARSRPSDSLGKRHGNANAPAS
jgi:biopolymer transport protein ExbD